MNAINFSSYKIRFTFLLTVVLTVGMIVPATADFLEGPVKWSQPITIDGTVPADLRVPVPVGSIIDGFDNPSDHTATDPTVIADDFTSDGRPIVGVRWWGSYAGATNQRPNGFTGPFDISFHLSDGNSHPGSLPVPGPPLALYELGPQDVQEFFVGLDGAGDFVYRYDVTLPPPFHEQAGVSYFLDIDKPTQEEWGWHLAGHLGAPPIQDWAALSDGPHDGLWQTLFDVNQAFELIAPEPTSCVLALLATVPLAACRRRKR